MTQWSTKKALTFLIGSTCLTLTVSLWGYSRWSASKQVRLADERYHLTTIVQTGPEKEALKTEYLAELLDLSIDRPISLYALDLKKVRSKLLSSPLIAKARVKRMPPSALYIDYEVRKPVALLVDYRNTGVDREGYFFPMAPFFSNKELPEIYLGLPAWGATEGPFWRIQNKSWALALEILEFLENSPWGEGLRIQRIDVSGAFAPTLGQREVVLFTEEEFSSCVFPKILRLMPKDYPEQLTHFFSLRRTMAEDYKKQLTSQGRFAPRIVDLRIPQLAFVQND